jgi:hypothetical protein
MEASLSHHSVPPVHEILDEERPRRKGAGDIGNICHFEDAGDDDIVRHVGELIFQNPRVSHQPAACGNGTHALFIKAT